MKELEPLAPSCVQNILTPVPDGYEMQMRGVTILAVDPKGEKPTLYFDFLAQSRGWRPYSGGLVIPLAPSNTGGA